MTPLLKTMHAFIESTAAHNASLREQLAIMQESDNEMVVEAMEYMEGQDAGGGDVAILYRQMELACRETSDLARHIRQRFQRARYTTQAKPE